MSRSTKAGSHGAFDAGREFESERCYSRHSRRGDQEVHAARRRQRIGRAVVFLDYQVEGKASLRSRDGVREEERIREKAEEGDRRR